MVRRCGVFVAGALLFAACSTGSEAEPPPLETAPAVTPAPTDAVPEVTTPSTETTGSTEVIDGSTATAPDSTTTEVPESDGPVEVFREAAAAFNEVQLNPEDESIRPAAYDLMTERFRADRSFEVLTGDPQFLDPYEEIVVLSEPEFDESGASATLWYCVREQASDTETGVAFTGIRRASMELVDGGWLWADRRMLGRSADGGECPSDVSELQLVEAVVSDEIELDVVAYFDARRLATESPDDDDRVADLVARADGSVLTEDASLLEQIRDLGVVFVRNPGASTEARVLGAGLEGADGDALVVVCEPDNTKIVRPGDDPEDQEFIERSIVWALRLSAVDGDWIVVDRQLVVDWQFGGECEAR